LGILLFARVALPQDDGAAGSSAPKPADPVAASVIDPNEIDRVDECIDAQVCIDRYLWRLYERTRKVDTIRVPEEVKASVKRRGRVRLVTRTVSKFVVEDFTWKDPDAAHKAGMLPQNYVIGGMDRAFRITLYHALRKLEEAGLMPGITSAFRDDYRQTIASGQKAQSDRSYHGGSFRGGYGHGMAADIVSVKGATHAERMAASGELWRFIDAHERELGIGRPYLDRDAPHVAPISGREYFTHRIEPQVKQAERTHQAEAKPKAAASKAARHRLFALHGDHGASRRARAARPTRAQSRSTRST
jgi:hypothetical protein